MHITKSTLKRSAVLSLFGGAAALLAGASTAWGCPGYPAINPVVNAPTQVVPGSQVEITGDHWSDQGVRILWASPTGVLLTVAPTNADGRFAKYVPVPQDAKVGELVTLYAREGDSAWEATTRVEVVPPGTPVETRPPVTTAGTSTGRASGGHSTAAAPGPIAAPIAAPGAAPAAGTAQPSAATAQPAPQPGIAAGVAPGTVSALPAAGGATPQLAATPTAAPAQPEQAAAEAKSTSRDLWGGFNDGKTQAADDAVKLPSSTTSPLPIGAAVLVGGLISLFAGFGLVEMRRRRAAA